MFLLLIEYHERRKLIKLSKTIVIRFFLFFALLGKVSSIGLNRVQNAELKHVVPRQLSRANLHVLQVSVQNISDFLSSLNRGDSSEQNGLMATTLPPKPITSKTQFFSIKPLSTISRKPNSQQSSMNVSFHETKQISKNSPSNPPPNLLFLFIRKPTISNFPRRFHPIHPPGPGNTLDQPQNFTNHSENQEKVRKPIKVQVSLTKSSNFSSQKINLSKETEKISSKTSSISKEVNSLRKVAPIKVSNRIFERPLSTVIKEEKLRFVVVPELQQDLTIYQHFSLTGARALLKSQMKPIVIIPKHSKTQPGMVIGTVKLPVMPSISVIDDELPFGTEIFMNRLKHRRKKFILSEIRK